MKKRNKTRLIQLKIELNRLLNEHHQEGLAATKTNKIFFKTPMITNRLTGNNILLQLKLLEAILSHTTTELTEPITKTIH